MKLSENMIQSLIRIALSKSGCVVRLNTGTFYQGKLSKHPVTHKPILTNIRAVKCGVEGIPDLLLIGNDGTVTFIEVKAEKGRTSEAQKRFMEFLKNRNHRCGIARSVDEAIEIVKGEKG